MSNKELKKLYILSNHLQNEMNKHIDDDEKFYQLLERAKKIKRAILKLEGKY